MILSDERLRELLTRYPPETQHALAVFQDIQKECGYLPKEHIIDAAQYLSMPLAKAYAIATFYRSFSLEPRGKYVIKVCDGTACHIKDSRGVLECLKRLLGVELGGTDSDGLFTVEEVACLGCCALAPAMQVGDEYFGKLDDEKIVEIISAFRAGEGSERSAAHTPVVLSEAAYFAAESKDPEDALDVSPNVVNAETIGYEEVSS